MTAASMTPTTAQMAGHNYADTYVASYQYTKQSYTRPPVFNSTPGNYTGYSVASHTTANRPCGSQAKTFSCGSAYYGSASGTGTRAEPALLTLSNFNFSANTACSRTIRSTAAVNLNGSDTVTIAPTKVSTSFRGYGIIESFVDGHVKVIANPPDYCTGCDGADFS